MGRTREQLRRQWVIVEGLRRRRRGMTVPQLVELAGVSRATIYRDLELLAESGIAITSERIEGQVRHCLMEGLHVAALEAHEVAALVLAREMLQPIAGLQMVDALDAMLRKLGAGRFGLGGAGAIDVPGAPVSVAQHQLRPDVRGTLRGIDLAIREGQRLSFEYRGGRDRITRRLVDPVSLRVYRGHPYLIGFDVDRNAWRIFKVVRIEGDLSLAGHAEPRPDYAEAELFRHSVGMWTGGEVTEVAVRLSAEVAHRAHEYPLVEGQTIEPSPDGTVIIRARVAGLMETARWVLAWGAAATVLEPAELREIVKGELLAAIAEYGEKR